MRRAGPLHGLLGLPPKGACIALCLPTSPGDRPTSVTPRSLKFTNGVWPFPGSHTPPRRAQLT